MTKYITIVVLCLIALVAIPAQADNLGVELAAVGEVVVNKVELSILGGLGDPAVGLYWPLVDVEKLGVTAGILGAIGNETVLGGIGVILPVKINIPILEEINILWGAREYNWKTHLQSWNGGVGRTFDVSF